MNKLLASVFYNVEVGPGRALVRLIPLSVVILGIIGFYNLKVYKGLNDQQSMDNCQLARQIVRHQPFVTYFIRPFALQQIATYKAAHGRAELYPEAQYPENAVRAIPDTYNSPGFPLLLAGFFEVLRPDFDETTQATGLSHHFAAEHRIPLINHVFILLTVVVLFIMGFRLFDERVAWMAPCAFLLTNFVWQFSLQATPIDLLFLLSSLLLWGLVELYRVAELPHDAEPIPYGWVWVLVPVLAVLFGVICLFSLPLLILMIPLLVFLGNLQRVNWLILPLFAAIAGLIVAPWFYHWYRACGNPLGSTFTWGVYGQGDYTGNQAFCNLTIPNYRSLFGAESSKELHGFIWYFQRGWNLLGSCPLVLLFAVSVLHQFRRKRVQAFRLLVVGSAFAIVAMTNLADPNPNPDGPWNLVVILLPAMILIGTAFFFTLLDRLISQLPLLVVVIVVATLTLCILPMASVFASVYYSFTYYNYPPYLPPLISYAGRANPPDRWIVSDMPWATAWYGDHVSLWLPTTPDDFSKINDNFNDLNMILFSPVTLSKPATTLTSGEMKPWMPYVLALAAPPATFPLHYFGKLPAEYLIVSNQRGNKASSGH